MRETPMAAVLNCVEGEPPLLEEVRAEASINDLLAEVTLVQRYRNAEDTNVEAVYTFPLPWDAVLLGLDFEIGDRTLAGTVVGKTEAEHVYEDAITDGDAAVMVEQVEPGLYCASIGNLLAGETVSIRFRYGLMLRWNGDHVRFMMPTTIAPRYGDPVAAGLARHQVPEHSVTLERPFALKVAIRGLLKEARFNSPSHTVSVAAEPDEAIVELAGEPAMDRDFVLEARAPGQEVPCALVAPDIDGWVALASFRPEIPESEDRAPRSVKIVVDCSGSMGGDSIAQARIALERILDALHTVDTFDIVAFGSNTRALFGRETPVSEKSLAKARRFVRFLDADMGGTAIGAALQAAYNIRGAGEQSQDLLLITDGEVWNSSSIVARARESGHRIFTVGVGSAVAEAFVRALADVTGGACELVAPRDDMAARIHRHFQRMYAPRAKKVTCQWPGSALRNLPDPIETVHGGDTVHLVTWFAEKPSGKTKLKVTLADGRTIHHEAEIVPFGEPAATPGADEALPSTLARLAAARSLATMEDVREASELAVRYQLMSRWTNYVVVHVRADADKSDELPTIRNVQQMLAAGWHGTGSVLSRSIAASRSAELLDMEVGRAGAEFRIPDGFDLKAPGMGVQPLGAEDVMSFGPEDLVAMLNARSIPPVPTLDELAMWGIPENLMEFLRDLVTGDGGEEAVVLAFLHELSQSPSGSALDRQIRRQILKAKKAHPLADIRIAAVEAIFQSWCSSEQSMPMPLP